MRLPLIVAILALLGTACATSPPPLSGESPRVVQPLTDGWLFRLDDGLDEPTARNSPASSWKPVSLPHTWNRLGEYELERTAITDERQGKGWYRIAIDGRSLDPSKRHFIEFDAVGNVADAWLNGRHLGQHRGAFSRFRFELADALDKSGQNILVVRADNSAPEPGSPTADVIPLAGDFFIYGGLYRPARLISVNASRFSMADFGGPGVYADVHDRGPAGAEVTVRMRLEGARAGQRVEAKIVEPDGTTVASGGSDLAANSAEAIVVLHLRSPRRWNGRADPYLYRLDARLTEGNTLLDRVEQPLGIRTARFDSNKGFFLNGKHLPLHGVSRHQDYLGKGSALRPEDHARDMALIAEIGANTVRFAHYQHAEDWFDLADRAGMVVWAEIPFVNKVAFGDDRASQALINNSRTQLIELIRQNYNHPSVVTWGIGNEVDIDLAFGRLGPRADARPLLRELNVLAQSEDPGRPTTIADCCEATPGKKVDYLPVLTGKSDLMGYNRYFGWYYGEAGDLGPHLDRLHAAHPNVPLSVSEYGAGGALTQHIEDSTGYKINAGGRPHPEEYQSWFHEQSWPQLRERPYLWATWVWNMFDFAARRKEGDAVDINDKGLVTFDRKVKKDAFFYYKAQWADAPVVHITSRRFVDRTKPVTPVKVYSNAPRVALSLNGKPLGDVACVDRICLMEQVRLTPGLNSVEAAASFPTGMVRDQVEWRLTAE